jgi:hypothetical protein
MKTATPTLNLMDLKKGRRIKSKGTFNKNTSMASGKMKSMTCPRFQNLKSQFKNTRSLPEGEGEAGEVEGVEVVGGDDDQEHH